TAHYTEDGNYVFETSNGSSGTVHVWGTDTLDQTNKMSATMDSNGSTYKVNSNNVGVIIANQNSTGNTSTGTFALHQALADNVTNHADGDFDLTNGAGNVNNTFTSNSFKSDLSDFNSSGSFTKGSTVTSAFIGPNTQDSSSGTFSSSEFDKHTHKYDTKG